MLFVSEYSVSHLKHRNLKKVVVLNAGQSRSLAVREHGLKGLKKRVRRRTFAPKKDKVTWDYRNYVELHKFYFPLNSGWHMGEITNAYKI